MDLTKQPGWDDAFTPWRELAKAAVDYVHQRRHGCFVDTEKTYQVLEQAVDYFLSVREDGTGSATAVTDLMMLKNQAE